MNREDALRSLKSTARNYFERVGLGLATGAEKAAFQTDIDKFMDASLKGGPAGQGGRTNMREMKSVLTENESIQRLLRDKRGTAVLTLKGDDCQLLERKTVTEAGQGFATSGVLGLSRIPGVTLEPRQRLTVRGLLSARPTTAAIVDFLKVSTPVGPASPQVEAQPMIESTLGFTTVSERVRTIGTFITCSRQILEDLPSLEATLNNSLPYYANLCEEAEILGGDSSGEHLSGLISGATAFNTGLLSPTKGWTTLDIWLKAKAQIAIAKEIAPSFIVCNPVDWYNACDLRDALGRFLLSDPASMAEPRCWGLDVVPTVSMNAGYFLMGSGNPEASEIIDRQETTVEIATQHDVDFTSNLVTIRVSKRLAFCLKRPGSYIYGALSSSPV